MNSLPLHIAHSILTEPRSNRARRPEERIHFLERLALGLRNKEPRPESHGDHQGREKEVRAVSERGNHIWRCAADDERPEPLVCCCDCDAEHADVDGEDLGAHDPGYALWTY